LKRKKIFPVVFVVVFLLLVPAGGSAAKKQKEKTLQVFSRIIFDQVYSGIQKEYFSKLTESEKIKIKKIRNEPIEEKKAIEKMLGMFEFCHIDSVYGSSNKASGCKIGVLFSPHPGGGLFIADVFPKSPAKKAGLKIGQHIVAIDGKPLKGLSFVEEVELISGDCDAFVELSVFSQILKKTFNVKIKREEETWPTEYAVSKLINKDVGFIKLNGFFLGSEKLFGESVKLLIKQGAKKWIISLKYNPGGFVYAADRILGEFLPNGLVSLHAIGRDRKISKFYVYSKWIRDRMYKIPPEDKVIVLVNDYSASASEIMAGALQDYRRATILGINTFGKGSMQYPIELSDRSVLMVTKVHFFTPVRKRAVDKTGIVPDITVYDNPFTEKDEMLEAALEIFQQLDLYGEIPMH